MSRYIEMYEIFIHSHSTKAAVDAEFGKIPTPSASDYSNVGCFTLMGVGVWEMC